MLLAFGSENERERERERERCYRDFLWICIESKIEIDVGWHQNPFQEDGKFFHFPKTKASSRLWVGSPCSFIDP